MDKYYSQFLAAPEDCEVIREVYSRLKFAGCSDVEEKFAALIKKGNEKCAPEKGPAELAYICLRDADYDCAIEGFLKASKEVEDAKKRENSYYWLQRCIMFIRKILQRQDSWL